MLLYIHLLCMRESLTVKGIILPTFYPSSFLINRTDHQVYGHGFNEGKCTEI